MGDRDGEPTPPSVYGNGERDRARVPIAALRTGYTPRLTGEVDAHVRTLAESETELPPILVHRGSMRVVDGMHRLRAAELRGEQTITVEFVDGTETDLLVLAVRANTRHGLPLTLADREAAAARILATCPMYADRAVAMITGLAARTVSVIRRRTTPVDGGPPARIGRDGRVRRLDNSHARRLAQEAIAARPQASLREIARVSGLSPMTVRDVRTRMRRNEPLEPPVRPAAGPANDGTGPGRAALLESLAKDPSLRFTDSGRALLRALLSRAGGPPESEMMRPLPPHCAYTVAALARACAQEWLDFAATLERKHESGS